MNKAELIDEINAFADARATGNLILMKRQKEALEHALSRLPDELPEVEKPQTEQ